MATLSSFLSKPAEATAAVAAADSRLTDAVLRMKLTPWSVDGKTERPQVLDDTLRHWIN